MKENENETAMAVMNQNNEGLSMNVSGDTQKAYSSLNNETTQEKAILYKAMSNPDKRLGDCINSVLHIKDVYMESVKTTNKETGEINECPRIVLVDLDGVSYQSVSFGIFNALKRIIQVFGEPTWEEGIALKVIQVTRGEKKMLSLDVQF